MTLNEGHSNCVEGLCLACEVRTPSNQTQRRVQRAISHAPSEFAEGARADKRWPMLVEIWPSLTKIGQDLVKPAGNGRHQFETVGERWPKLKDARPACGQIGMHLGQVWPKLAKKVRCFPNKPNLIDLLRLACGQQLSRNFATRVQRPVRPNLEKVCLG